ncbi:MAG: peptide-N-glycosidase F-related protein [Mucilaginibacter sp.]
MKIFFSILLLFSLSFNATYAQSKNETVISVIRDLNFYDGYAKPISAPVTPGLVQISNTKYIRKLTDQEKQSVGDSITVKVVVKFGCDDYDRIGRVTLFSVPKDKNYDSPEAKEFELLRIMTPFNYKTREPDNIPYTAFINQLAGLFKDKGADIWIMTEIFGTTGAGQKETMGCDGSLLTYTASVNIFSYKTKKANPVKPIALLSYYALNGQDTTAGQNATAVSFHTDHTIKSAVLYLITSGHGAAQGGEEYNWREHVVYVDGKEVARVAVNQNCAPYEIYNTRTNGIYGPNIAQERRSWCPGAPVPTRAVNLGTLPPGNHTVKIAVPEAILLSTQSTYYLSAYIAGQ